MSQNYDNHGYVICYLSSSLSGSKRKYSTTEVVVESWSVEKLMRPKINGIGNVKVIKEKLDCILSGKLLTKIFTDMLDVKDASVEVSGSYLPKEKQLKILQNRLDDSKSVGYGVYKQYFQVLRLYY